MSAPLMIGPEAESLLDWPMITAAIADGHALPRAELADTFLRRGADTLLTRSAMIDGLGALVKAATVFPANARHGMATVNGAACLFSDATGGLEALVDFDLLTRWKTVGDSLLAARRLAPPRVQRITILGAGNVARTLVSAYRSVWPEADIAVWNRNAARAEALAGATGIAVARDLAGAVRDADIVASATMAVDPLIRGDWLRPGQHLDLIGAFRPDMREADDTALQRARIFVDSRATTLDHIGELKIPIASGVIGPGDIRADFYELDAFVRSADDITLFKNGGGAHLDLIVARAILGAFVRTGRDGTVAGH